MDDKTIARGHPSYVWRFGQDRRLRLIQAYLPDPGAWVLDVGCGIGTYIEKLRVHGAHAFGVDVEPEWLARARHEKQLDTLALSVAEALPFASDTFDGVLLHEVIEHVRDDRQTICEAHRVVKPGGVVIVFAPNRWYPFETHGAYVGRRYVFGNIPCVGYLPDRLRARVAPHVRAYRRRELQRLFAGLDGQFLVHTQIYPGYDKLARRHACLAHLLRRVTFALESTPLRFWGLSHFAVWRKHQGAPARDAPLAPYRGDEP